MPTDPDRPVRAPGWAALRDAWTARGWLVDCRPGPLAEALLPGGFDRVWISLPRGGPALFANQQGGYRAQCPGGGAIITGAFARALQAWVEKTGPFALSCPACGGEHALPEVRLAPPGAFGRFAIVFSDVSALDISAAAREEMEDVFGSMGTVLRRVG